MKVHRTVASDGPANCPSRIEGVARRLKGRFDRKCYRNREREQKLHIGTWNVTSLTGKESELVDEAIRYRLDIVGVSFTKRKGHGTLVLHKRWQLFYSGVDPARRAQAGVGILTNPRLAEGVVAWRQISERVALLRLKLKEKTLALVQLYAPNTESEYAPFLDEVLGVLEGIPGTDSIVLLRDFNAHDGDDPQTWQGVIGKSGDSDTNVQGRLLLDFCAGGGLSIMNTFFHHKDIHKYTWYRLGDSATQKSLIGLFVVSDDLRNNAMDVCVKRGAELPTDHHRILCKLRLALSSRMQRFDRKGQKRIRWETLADEAVRHNFSENVDQRFSHLPSKEADVETEWSLFRTSILGIATEMCGVKPIGPPIGQKRTPWQNDEVCAVVAEKKYAYRAWVGQQTAETRQKYLQARDKTKEAVAKAKATSWENFGHRLESDYLSAGKVFWQTIHRLRRGACPMIYSIKSAFGDLLSCKKDILNRWKEYFMELYNPTS